MFANNDRIGRDDVDFLHPDDELRGDRILTVVGEQICSCLIEPRRAPLHQLDFGDKQIVVFCRKELSPESLACGITLFEPWYKPLRGQTDREPLGVAHFAG